MNAYNKPSVSHKLSGRNIEIHEESEPLMVNIIPTRRKAAAAWDRKEIYYIKAFKEIQSSIVS